VRRFLRSEDSDRCFPASTQALFSTTSLKEYLVLLTLLFACFFVVVVDEVAIDLMLDLLPRRLCTDLLCEGDIKLESVLFPLLFEELSRTLSEVSVSSTSLESRIPSTLHQLLTSESPSMSFISSIFFRPLSAWFLLLRRRVRLI